MTSPVFPYKSIALLISNVLLASCGGGSSNDQPANPNAISIVTAAAPTLGDCFVWTPGVNYIKTDSYKTLMIQEQFEGQTAISDMELRPDDTRWGGAYIVVDTNFVTILGENHYDTTGVYAGKDVYTNYRLPVNMAVGQTVQVNYSHIRTRVNPPSVTTQNATIAYRLEGFETLALGGKTFENVCKLRSSEPGFTETSVQWIAKGFGVIKQEHQNTSGATVPGTLRQLVTIVAGS